MIKKNELFTQAIVVLLFALVAITASAQKTNHQELLHEKVQRLGDSIDNLTSGKATLYLGYEISMAFQRHQIQSNISQLNNVKASFSGGAVGGVFANQRGKVKANIGLYYSDGSVPYSIDLLRTSVTSSLYLLRLKGSRYRTFEPYAVVGLVHQIDKFFGYYLDNSARTNYSASDEPLLGKLSTTQVTFGGGLEYQLESERLNFIHLFGEVTYAKNMKTTSSNNSFSGTAISDPLLVSIGINFGIIK